MLNNQTPFAAERCWVRDINGAEVWLVAVKATFDIQKTGELTIAEKQEEVNIAPKFRADPAVTSLEFETDLPHLKLATDVLVEGHAYSPNGKPVSSLTVRLKVANIDKSLNVTGDRIWYKSPIGVNVSDIKPFIKMPIIYERAYGGAILDEEDEHKRGWEPKNPVGLGYAKFAPHLIDTPVPNIEDPNSLRANFSHRSHPVGFGPIAGHWAPRVKLAGTYDKKWEESRQPLLPLDFNEKYYQVAPADQQVPGYLKGGEIVELTNMSPGGLLRFKLPRISLSFNTQFSDGTKQDHRSTLHTLVIKPDAPKVTMVWHTHLPCHFKVLKLTSTTIRLKNRIMTKEKEEEISNDLNTTAGNEVHA